MTPSHVDAILNRLDGVRKTGEQQWEARCPAHDDNRASLAVSIGRENRVLLHCHAGCDLITITRAIGLSIFELFPEGHVKRRQADTRPAGKIVATYPYCAADGEVLYEVVRMEPKSFRQRRPDGVGGWVWGLGDVRRVLFRLPELLAAPADAWVYVAEGEKDVLALVGRGLVATCNSGGAGRWPDNDDALERRRVCVIADADGPGRKHAREVAERLTGRAADVRIIELPGAKDAAAWLAAGGTVECLAELRDAVRPHVAGETQTRAHIVQTGKQLRELVAESSEALCDANTIPTVFVRAGELVRIVADEHGAPHIQRYDKPSLRSRLSQVADFYTLRKTRDDWEECVADPKLAVVEAVLGAGEWDLPGLLGVTRAPIIRPDGTICTVPGYDSATRLYYCPAAGLKLGVIPAQPNTHAVHAAMDVIVDVIADFPFADDASRANALAILFTLLMRPVIDGHVPLALVDAPVQGTGKSLLVSVLASIAIGDVSGESIPAAQNEDEWRKKITSILMRGSPFVLLDNVPDGTPISAPPLAAVLTSHEWSDRKLGSSESITLPSRAFWTATGNNLAVEGDMPRRTFLVRLDANAEQPWAREGFRIPDLQRHVTQHRAELLTAALVVIRAWYAAGRPSTSVPRMGSFEAWAETIGGVLAYAGVGGFLGNLREVAQMRDEESSQWAVFFDAWWREYRDRAVSVVEIADRLSGPQTTFEAAIPDALLVTRDHGPGSLRRSLGRHLAKRAGRVVEGRKLLDMGTHTNRHLRMWRLQPVHGEVSDIGETPGNDKFTHNFTPQLPEFG